MLKKLNVETILHAESDRVICVSVIPIMSLLIILLSLTISLTCFERDLILWKRIVIVSSEIILLFNMENKSFSSRHSYSNNASLITFIADFKIPLYNKDYYKFLPH